jgi:tRNA (cytidine/uridine-2'-O-)-methyltransferase
MFHIALVEPEIPPNAGNIARLCAATGTRLHLVGRLGFRLDDASLKRAGLDYWPHVDHARYATWEDFIGSFVGRLWLVECPAEVVYSHVKFEEGDCLVFGSESQGLPASIRTAHASRMIGIPMPTGAVRSLNIATAAGVVLYEALRQQGKW